MKKMIMLSILGLFLFCNFSIALAGESKLERGIVVGVEYEVVAGDFWNNPKKYTIIRFKDGRSVIYNCFVRKVFVNRCNQFMKNSWNNVITAILCREIN